MSIKQLPAGALNHLADYMYSTRFVVLPPDVDSKELFKPGFWAHHAVKLKLNDIVRVRADDGSFDFMLTVIRKDQGAVLMDIWPKYPVRASSAEAASDAMAKVAAESRSTLVRSKVLGKEVPRVEHTKATKWRVIGLDGKEYAKDFDVKEDAEKAMDKYMTGLGITKVEDAA